MIVNNTITATLRAPPLSWQPSTTFLSTLLTATLLTLLSYQAAAPAPLLHALLLADEGSPLSVAAALLRVDPLDRLRCRLPPATAITRTPARTTRPAGAVLLLLLAAAPLANILAVALAFEHDSVATFAQGQVACSRYADALTCDAIAQFHVCDDSVSYRQLDSPAAESKVRVIASAQGEIRVDVFILDAVYIPVLTTRAAITTRENVYRLPHALHQPIVARFAATIAQHVDSMCDQPGFIPDGALPLGMVDGSDVVESRLRNVVAEAPIECTNLQPAGTVGTGSVIAAATAMKTSITLVEVPTQYVVVTTIPRGPERVPRSVRGDTLPLVVTRGPVMPALWIAIAVASVLLVRFLVETVTHNDVADGLEAVVAAGLGCRDGYDLIRSDQYVRYDCKLQRGTQFHFGVQKSGWREIASFDRAVGVLPGDDEESSDGKLDAT